MLAGAQPKLEVVKRESADGLPPSIEEQLEEAIEGMRCYDCGTPTDRLITFQTAIGIVREYECLDCRQKRVKRQVEEGLRPESDLLPENLPERRNPL